MRGSDPKREATAALVRLCLYVHVFLVSATQFGFAVLCSLVPSKNIRVAKDGSDLVDSKAVADV